MQRKDNKNTSKNTLIDKSTFDLFKQYDNIADLVSIFAFYNYTACWQGTNQPKATVKYVSECLRICEKRVWRANKILIQLKLIQKVTRRNKYNRITGLYIRINRPWTEKKAAETIDKNNIGSILKELLVEERFHSSLKKWFAYKEEIGQPVKSKKTIYETYHRLQDLSSNDEYEARKIVNLCIANGWHNLCKPSNKQKLSYQPKEKIEYGIRWYLDEKTGNYYDSEGNKLK
jgi:hypothetical protein